MADAIHQTSPIVCQKDDGAPGEAGNITSAARPRQPLHFIVAVTPRGIQVAEAINFRGTQKAHVDPALLKKAHDIEHLATLGCAQNIGGITHRVEKLG